MFITKSEAKKHLNIDDDFVADDDYIISLIQVAEELTSKLLNRELKEYVVRGELRPTVRQTVLLLVGSFYANREETTFAKPVMNPTFDYLIQMNKKYAIP